MAKREDPGIASLFRDLDEDQREFYRGLDPAVAVCRGRRRHKFPGLVPGTELSPYVDIRRIQGVYEVTEYCERDCGRSITYSAGQDGRPDYTTASYGGWKNGRQLATGLGLTATDDREYMTHIQKEAVTDGFKLARARRRRKREAAEAAIAAGLSVAEAG